MWVNVITFKLESNNESQPPSLENPFVGPNSLLYSLKTSQNRSQPPSLENPFVGAVRAANAGTGEGVVSTSKPGESLCGLQC